MHHMTLENQNVFGGVLDSGWKEKEEEEGKEKK